MPVARGDDTRPVDGGVPAAAADPVEPAGPVVSADPAGPVASAGPAVSPAERQSDAHTAQPDLTGVVGAVTASAAGATVDAAAVATVGTTADAAAAGTGPAGTAEVVGAPGGAAVVLQPSRRDRRTTKKRRVLPWAVGVCALALVVAVASLVVVGVRRPLPAPALVAFVPATTTVSGSLPSLPWPTKGGAAVAIPALGYTAESGNQSPEPIASLTKMTTAVLVLTDHPIPVGSPGPSITITAVDVAEYDNDVDNDQSTLTVREGEVLSERQMIEALLIRSANNIAYALAVWDAGSEAAFVAKMNAFASAQGMTSTHYVDVSGFDPHTVSSSSDCLRVASVGMAIPAFAETVAMPSVTLPLVGTVPNIVTEVGSNGVIGVKSGYTSQAGGCMVLAGTRTIAGQTVLVLVAVTGQPVPPAVAPTTTTTTTTTTAPGAGHGQAPPPSSTTSTTTTPYVPDPFEYTRPVVEALLTHAEAGVVGVVLTTPGSPAGTATATWDGVPHDVPVVAGRTAGLLAWPGQVVQATTHLEGVPAGAQRGLTVGTAQYTLGTQQVTVPLQLARPIPVPSLWWRLTHR